MPARHKPRAGSMQFWPRKRADSQRARVRSISPKHKGLLFSAGYKVGMAHLMAKDNTQNSMSKNSMISIPVTILECPPLKVIGARYYKTHPNSSSYTSSTVTGQIFADNLDKQIKQYLNQKTTFSKKVDQNSKTSPSSSKTQHDDIRFLVATQPGKTSIGKKVPEIFEVPFGGTLQDKEAYLQNNLGKDVEIDSVFTNNQMVDLHAVTKGKGVQGAVKRFGIHLRQHKSEKTKRGVGSLGPWNHQGHVMYRVPHAGQTGYHMRTQYNNLILSIDNKNITPSSGFNKYGLIKNKYLLLRGSIPGSKKRCIILSHSVRNKQSKYNFEPKELIA